MSYCVSHGKDKVMFLTEEDLKKPSSVVLPEDDEPRGFLLANGEINWGCPCLGNMVVGPCSVEFRQSLSCFHQSTADPKGSDCLEQFREMNECMDKYPSLYKRSDDEERMQRLEKSEQESMKNIDPPKSTDDVTKRTDDVMKSTDESNRTIAKEL